MQDSQAGPNRLLVSGQDLPGPGPMRGRRGESRDWSQRTATARPGHTQGARQSVRQGPAGPAGPAGLSW